MSGSGEFCLGDTFNASCSGDDVIMMTHAEYGRMRIGKCMKESYGHHGCSTDVISAVDSRCFM